MEKITKNISALMGHQVSLYDKLTEVFYKAKYGKLKEARKIFSKMHYAEDERLWRDTLKEMDTLLNNEEEQ